jgi:L-ascorbate metabolism protein UlaG (beta-lactamase superfamily)
MMNLVLLAGLAAVSSTSGTAAIAAPASPAAITTPEKGTAGSTSAAPDGLEITWFGQSCFMMRTPGGTTVLMDPVASEIGYKPPTVKADLVTISHEHPDHNNLKMVEVVGSQAGGAEIVRGLTKAGWADVDESVGDVHVTSVHVFHDDKQGAKYGRNAIFVFDVAGRRVVHLGDLGHALDDAQIKALGKVDVLMIPIGGTYTIDAAGANALIAAVKPRYVIFPMHYKTPQLKIRELVSATEFLAGKKNVLAAKGGSYTVSETKGGTPPSEPLIVLLKAD